jgi:hypothetical protein
MKKRLLGVAATALLAVSMVAAPVAASNDNSCEGQWAALDAQFGMKILGGQSLGDLIRDSANHGQDFRTVMHNLCEVFGTPPKFKDL